MRGRRPRASFVATFVALALVAPACKDANGGPSRPVVGGTLVDTGTFAAGDPAHIDPAHATERSGQQVAALLFEGLTVIDAKTGRPRPGVARAWTSDARAKAWVFTLRKTVFSDGTPVLPSDFKFAWERAPDVARDVPIKAIVADDSAMTLKVNLESSMSWLPSMVAHTRFSPVPQKAVAALADQSAWERGLMVGNGAFRMREPWKHGEHIKLARNERYWGGVAKHKAYLAGIDFEIAKPGGRVRAGRVLLATDYLGFNQKDPLVGGPANLRLREAITVAVDRAAINKAVFDGERTVATGFTPPGVPGYDAKLTTERKRDLERAKQLYREYGRKPNIRLSFPNTPEGNKINAIVQRNLEEIGIHTVLLPVEPAAYPDFVRSGADKAVQLFQARWVYEYVAYDNGMQTVFTTGGRANLTNYRDAGVDHLVAQSRAVRDEEARNALCQNAEKILLDNAIVIPITWERARFTPPANAQNIVVGASGLIGYKDVWMVKRRP